MYRGGQNLIRCQFVYEHAEAQDVRKRVESAYLVEVYILYGMPVDLPSASASSE